MFLTLILMACACPWARVWY